MKNKKEIQEELEALSPKLAKLKKTPHSLNRNGLPKGYFDSLPDQVFARIAAEKPQAQIRASEEKPMTWVDKLLAPIQILMQPQLAVGFGIALLFFIALAYFMIPKGEASIIADKNALQDIQEEALYEYVLNNIEEFDSEIILDIAVDIPLEFILPESIELDESLDQIIEELMEEVDFTDGSDIL